MKIMSRNVDVRGTNVAAVRALFSQNDTNTVAKNAPKLAPKPAQPSPRVSTSPKSSPVIETATRRSPSTSVPARQRQQSFTSVEHLKLKFQNVQPVRTDPPERVKTPNGNESKTFVNIEKEKVQVKVEEPKVEEVFEVEEVKFYPPKTQKAHCKDKYDRVDGTEISRLEVHLENSALIIPPEPLSKPLQPNTSQLANILDRRSVKNQRESRFYANITAIENPSLLQLPIAPPTPITTSPISPEEPIFMFGKSAWRKKPLPPLSKIGQLPPPKPQRPSSVTALARGAWADIATPQLPERKPFAGTNNSGLGLGPAQFPQRRTHVNTRRESCDPLSVFEEKMDSFITPTTSSNEELYDDTASQVPPPPPRPDRLLKAMPATVETEELYDDTSIQLRTHDGEIYEDISQESENAHYVNGEFSRKPKTLSWLRRDSKDKDKDKKQKDPDKLKKKFHLTGQEIVVETGIIKETAKNKKEDFIVRKGERIRILRMSNNPAGKWLVINESGEMGYVELTNIEVDANSVKSVMFQSNNVSPSMRSIPEAQSYQEEDAEAIYEEFH